MVGILGSKFVVSLFSTLHRTLGEKISRNIQPTEKLDESGILTGNDLTIWDWSIILRQPRLIARWFSEPDWVASGVEVCTASADAWRLLQVRFRGVMQCCCFFVGLCLITHVQVSLSSKDFLFFFPEFCWLYKELFLNLRLFIFSHFSKNCGPQKSCLVKLCEGSSADGGPSCGSTPGCGKAAKLARSVWW